MYLIYKIYIYIYELFNELVKIKVDDLASLYYIIYG